MSSDDIEKINMKENEILIRVHACALNSDDINVNGDKSNNTTDFHKPKALGHYISGEIIKIGKEVDDKFNFIKNDTVVGVISYDDINSGCQKYITLPYELVMKKNELLSHEIAAASLFSGLRAYSALFYKFHVVKGKSILIYNGASNANHISTQLALNWNLGIVFVTCESVEEMNYLNSLSYNGKVRVINIISENVESVVMSETCGIGIDYILEGTEKLNFEDQVNMKRRNVRLLAPNGHLITSQLDYQFSSDISKILYLKNASISFLFEQSWLLSNTEIGRFRHIMNEVLEASRTWLQPHIDETFSLENINEGIKHLQEKKNSIGCVVMKM